MYLLKHYPHYTYYLLQFTSKISAIDYVNLDQ